MKKITIVIPVFCEEQSLPFFWNNLLSVVNDLISFEFTFIFVNDGSEDSTFEILLNFSRMDSRVKIIDFSRNFGKEVALVAGAVNAKDFDALITIDCDMQHPPVLILEMLQRWESGAEIVVALRTENLGHSTFRKYASNKFNFIMNKISHTEFKKGSTDFRLYDKKIINEFVKFRERIRTFRSLIDWMGFTKDYIYFSAPDRLYGISNYSKIKLLKLALDGFTTFTLLPLKIIGLLGLIIMSTSLCLLTFMLYGYFFSDVPMYTPLAIFVVINTFLVGLILIVLGLLALYIGNIQTEVLGRPLYIIRKIINE
jgi:glycosyltransferase involved in cell wall biosynthesis